MSADNWGVCPRCLKKTEEDCDNLDKMITEGYGTIPAEDYLKLLEKSKELAAKIELPDDFDHTLREDYEMYTTETGTFFVSYRGECHVCGFSHKFEKEEQLSV